MIQFNLLDKVYRISFIKLYRFQLFNLQIISETCLYLVLHSQMLYDLAFMLSYPRVFQPVLILYTTTFKVLTTYFYLRYVVLLHRFKSLVSQTFLDSSATLSSSGESSSIKYMIYLFQLLQYFFYLVSRSQSGFCLIKSSKSLKASDNQIISQIVSQLLSVLISCFKHFSITYFSILDLQYFIRVSSTYVVLITVLFSAHSRYQLMGQLMVTHECKHCCRDLGVASCRDNNQSHLYVLVYIQIYHMPSKGTRLNNIHVALNHEI